MNLEQSILEIKGIGQQTANKFAKLGISTLGQLLEHYPREYEDRRKTAPLNNLAPEEINNIIAIVATPPKMTNINNKIIVTFKVTDKLNSIFITFFGQAYIKNQFKVGQMYNFYGKVTEQRQKITMQSPEFTLITDPNNLEQILKIVPIYPTTFRLSQKIIRHSIAQGLNDNNLDFIDLIPNSLTKKYNLLGKFEAVNNIHFPKTNEDFFNARTRLIFEELFMLQLSLYLLKEDFKQQNKGTQKEIPEEYESFITSLPFKLTNAQNIVVNEIINDMQSPFAGNRLVQGDVGSGKTIVAFIALFIAVKNGFQGMLMAPTEVLAQQHFEFAQKIFAPFNVTVELLTGSTTKKQKQIILENLQNETLKIIIGTHALIEDNVEIANLGLVITDEQHRFGVRQRLKLSKKGNNPDVLVMTATPIPRTLALILYGDMSISVIDELPPNRQPIKTNAVNTSYYPRIYAFIKKHLDEGRQCYIICPMVEESENLEELKNVINYTQELQENIFNTYQIAYLHGKMKGREKTKIMEDFAKGNTQILVSTTVIEVGVNVPNATIILIENAERFGLAQLHQLRGRVGRGIHQSFCILISNSTNKTTIERLKIMEKSNDGFVIANTDLQLRGQGEFFGTRQHGIPEMKIANLYTDSKILNQVQIEVEQILETDPKFEKAENRKLYNYIMQQHDKQSLYNAL
ncbi:MAG: ATP-dependent DNA helicase RecG [Epulopiscium sp. Nele67-Bin005]|nr:MAG: ATP-dependent DNA helicase RecG [Epulopiscium sp. Nele67-Bin005]